MLARVVYYLHDPVGQVAYFICLLYFPKFVEQLLQIRFIAVYAVCCLVTAIYCLADIFFIDPIKRKYNKKGIKYEA